MIIILVSETDHMALATIYNYFLVQPVLYFLYPQQFLFLILEDWPLPSLPLSLSLCHPAWIRLLQFPIGFKHRAW